MRSVAAAIVMLSVVLIGVSSAASHHRNPDRDIPCEHIHWQNVDDTRRAVRRLIRCAENSWPVPGGARKALEVAACESGFWPWAQGGSNAGVYQHNLTYWRPRWERWGRPLGLRPSPYNARTNVVVTMRMVHATRSWTPWACA